MEKWEDILASSHFTIILSMGVLYMYRRRFCLPIRTLANIKVYPDMTVHNGKSLGLLDPIIRHFKKVYPIEKY